jgi:hypothetical protein
MMFFETLKTNSWSGEVSQFEFAYDTIWHMAFHS